MSFAPFNAHTTPLFKNCNILKFADIINVKSCIFINNCFDKGSFSIFNKNVKIVSTTHLYNIISARNDILFVPSYNTARCGRKPIISSITLTWNYLQDKLHEYNFLCLTPRSLEISLFLSITVKLKANEQVAMMTIYYEYEIVYIYRLHMTELSVCDICNMPIAILINFVFLFLLLLFVSCNLFLKKIF